MPSIKRPEWVSPDTSHPICLAAALTCLSLLAACGSSEEPHSAPQPKMTRAELLDSTKCRECHTRHYDDWAASMHAYATDDPVFVAMNKRGQRETNGQLGDFCLKCHAPMAVHENVTQNGAVDLATLPASLKGVTCFFCHSADSVDAAHPYNNAVHLSDDLVMRGGIGDPVQNDAHRMTYSSLHDGNTIQSAPLCGTCHDIRTTEGAHVERTYEEWLNSQWSKPVAQSGAPSSCSSCHMPGYSGLAADGEGAQKFGVKLRTAHDHTFPFGVDVAITDGFPRAEEMRKATEAQLQTGLTAAVCVESVPNQYATIEVDLDSTAVGHKWPSGATQDRRAWVEVVAYSGSQIVYHSGTAPDGSPLPASTRIVDLQDPDLWLIRDCMFDSGGQLVHNFWEAASYDANQLPVATSTNQQDPNAFNITHIFRTYPLGERVIRPVPDRVTVRLLLQPIGIDVLDELAGKSSSHGAAPVQDLDPAVVDRMPLFSVLVKTLEWTPATADVTQPVQGKTRSCKTLAYNINSKAYEPAKHQNPLCTP